MNSMKGTYIAHVREKDRAVQSLEEHLFNTAALSRKFAEKIGLGAMGELQGLLHDIGKFSADFQAYLSSAEGLVDQNCDEYVDAEQLRGKIDHSTAGAQFAWSNFNHSTTVPFLTAQILALSLASHHSGLIDCLAPDGADVFTKRIEKSIKKTHFDEVTEKIPPKVKDRIGSLVQEPELTIECKKLFSSLMKTEKSKNPSKAMERSNFMIGLTLRFLFSCLIDADRTDTADFEKQWLPQTRQAGRYVPWNLLVQRFEKSLASFENYDPISEARRKVSEECWQAAGQPKGYFTLTVPTGGGKTLASLRFALNHALNSDSSARKIDRIIYIIPYTSIIDQNAQVAREILEPPEERNMIVLESHSNLSGERESWKNRLLSENWDAPIVFTTSVQFLETLFAGGTKSVRRMHQLAHSILIFDEIQTLPIRTVHMFCNALNFLVEHCGASAVLCTATQPLLHRVNPALGSLNLGKENEIVQDVPALFETFRRVKVYNKTIPVGYTDEEIVCLALEQQKNFQTCLVVVNTTGMARRLYRLLSALFPNTVHLSASMCPAHRREVLARIRRSLGEDPQSPLVCVSTQVIEAGVDVDFGCVIRCLAGMDSIAQAGGRCNRHGKRDIGHVLIINPREDPIDRLIDIKVGRDETKLMLLELKNENLEPADFLSPSIMSRYFERYFFKRASEMAYPVAKHRNDTLLNMLSLNTYAAGCYLSHGNTPQIPLKQSFGSAASIFSALDATTRGVLVPYGDGAETIAELCGDIYEPSRISALLHKAQQFSVNVYPNILEKLVKANAVYELNGLEVWALREEYYSLEFGLSDEAITGLRMEVH